MTENNNENLDYESMSEEELGAFLDKAESNNQPQEVQEEVQEEVTEEVTEETTEETTEEEEEDSRYKGKSRADLIKSISEGTQKISRQNNEIYLSKKEVEQLKKDRESYRQSISKPVKEEEEDPFSGYNKEDISVIEKLVEKRLDERDKIRIRKEEEDKKRTAEDNESAWNRYSETLSVVDPESNDRIKNSIIEAIQGKGMDRTLNKKGWVQNFVKSNLKVPKVSSNGSSTLTNSSRENLIKRKSKAATVNGGVSTSSGGSLKGKPEPSDPEKYVEWLETNYNIKI